MIENGIAYTYAARHVHFIYTPLKITNTQTNRMFLIHLGDVMKAAISSLHLLLLVFALAKIKWKIF